MSRTALAISFCAVVLAVTGAADAARSKLVEAVSKPEPGKALRLNASGKLPRAAFGVDRARPGGLVALNGRRDFPDRALPAFGRARGAATLRGLTGRRLARRCPRGTLDRGTWCIMREPMPAAASFVEAARACRKRRGRVPSADQLVSSASRIRLMGKLNDSPRTAVVDQNPSDGLKDARELSSTTVTTGVGSEVGGNARANPEPSALEYLAVFDNRNVGGFGGAVPITQRERFRCAFDQSAGGGNRR